MVTAHLSDDFYITLVDIQHAATQREIKCVSVPLRDKPLYVALSYRWGQVAPVRVETGLGYVANVTAFALDDLYDVCEVMTHDFQEPYVWVDAICVDHANLSSRLTTLYNMYHIYDQAAWMLAVPDLHQASLSPPPIDKQLYDVLHGRRAHEAEGLTYLTQLFNEWAGRVLVISECVIARRNNKFKLWFSLLHGAGHTCFPFDLQTLTNESHAFYTNMAIQLRPRSFLDMMLASQTKNHEDRFYGILPISPYRHVLTSPSTIHSWHISSLLDVQLKLYEIMTLNDKARLLFMSQPSDEPPTFAGALGPELEGEPRNIQDIILARDPIRLTVTSTTYDTHENMVRIPFDKDIQYLYLIGSFEKDRWALTKRKHADWVQHQGARFVIY